MAGQQYFIDTDNLFEDVDDATFLKNASTSSTNPFAQDLERQRQVYEQRRMEIEQRTLETSHRSIGLLRETEQVGMATAEELARQREQLENTSHQLDNITTNLRYSQKHLNGLKSLFGGLKNYIAGRNDSRMSAATSQCGSKLSLHESMRPTSSNNLSPNDLYDTHPINRFRNEAIIEKSEPGITTASSFSQQLDRNLDEMVGSLSRLKGLAMDLGQEIESQNDLIDTIHDKVDDTDIKLIKQNKEMNKLLGKK